METISKTKIEKRMRKKTNLELIGIIIKLKKTNPLIAKLLATPVKKQNNLNLDEIESKTKQGDKILLPGKVLSRGELSKKLKIVAWAFSEKALEKIKKSGSESILIKEEMKKNPELKELKLIE